MCEENKRFNWAGLFIKLIIVVIFILFTVWLLSLSNKGLSNSLDVLTDNIFVENIEKMKEVGKSYFTTERLPKKNGDVSQLTLSRMYDKKLILELRDRNGKTCSADSSYVSIEKIENEYQMKVYLECGNKKDFVIYIMGCYSYCESDICEKQEENLLEYEYKKTVGGSWTNWSSFSNWSKKSVTKTSSRDVETKVVSENSTVKKLVGDVSCPSVGGYTLAKSENGVCTYNGYGYIYDTLSCPYASGYKYDSKNGTTCNYISETLSYEKPICGTVSGYTNTGIDGFTCNYSKTSSTSIDPVCPTIDGYTNTGRNGVTCSYSKVSSTSTDPVCPTIDGYTYTGREGLSCNYSKSYKVPVGKTIVSDCAKCAKTVQTIYETKYLYQIADADCPPGYKLSGNTCIITTTDTTTGTAICPLGYSKSGNICVTSSTDTTTRTATCPLGYSKLGKNCVGYDTTTREAVCPNGYTKSGDYCIGWSLNTITKNAICSSSNQTIESGKCYEQVTDKKNVTYYRYRTRSFVGGTTDYKWSTSNNDDSLLSAGYVLTGKSREVNENGGSK